MNSFRRNTYRILWAVLFGQAAFSISAIVAERVIHSYDGSFAFGAGLFVTFVLGFLGGWTFANRSFTWHRFHLVCLIVGGCLSPILVSQAVLFHQRSVAETRPEFMGPLKDAILAGLCFYFSVAPMCLFIAGTATTLDRWRFSLRTLFIIMTCTAATLGAIFVLSRHT
jgi:hypothetical protein